MESEVNQMASTYEPIATNTVTGSAVSSVTFSSIPQTYTDLIIVATVQASTGGDLCVQFNGDTGTNYSITYLYGNGSSAGSTRQTNKTFLSLDYYGGPPTSGSFNNEIIQIQNYSNSSTYKTVLVRANNAASGLDASVGLWRNTNAITQIDIIIRTATANINVGSTFTLFGIKAA